MSVQDTVEGFRALIDGDLDEYPEQAFLYAGNAEDVQRKASEMSS